MRLTTVSLADANEYVSALHRHHKPVRGHKFSLGALGEDDDLLGVAIVGRPVARGRDDGKTLEVTRLCTDGSRNVCSFLYGAVVRAGRALGYARVGTYTLPEEGGASLRGAGWKLVGETRGGKWVRSDGTPRNNSHPLGAKWLWEVEL